MSPDAHPPRIVCFMCNWAFCEEEMRIPYNVDIIRVMCVGRMDPVLVLETFINGAEGVMLVGCKPSDCHFVDGNLHAQRAVKMLKKLLALTGLEPERLKLLLISPLEDRDFSHYAKEFTEEVWKLGNSPLSKEEIVANLAAAKEAVSAFRLRVLLGREEELTEFMNAYGEKIPEEEFEALLDGIVKAEFIRYKIHYLTRVKPRSVKELAQILGIRPSAVLRHITNMRRKGMITLDKVEGYTPLYKALEVR
ncbi:MAG: hydrogenase iron-sulfur subunit [Candidatus Bathyarchaeota archaeon]|nr:hydrogenase iron-sulfur subunit [Candidatus Bathyarchaeota archaeon]MDW8040453.1 hydrogenase iron-sulfur subunit [Nitrososphaerota archaeon]